MSNKIRTDIQDSSVEGDFAGRDIVKNTYVFEDSKKESNYISSLYEKLQNEKENNSQIKENLEELLHYKNPINGNVIGLDDKLHRGGLDSLSEYAKRSKERFTKKLIKDEYYESAQEIYAYLLALVESNFNRYVYPEIQKNVENSVIQSLVDRHICDPINSALGKNILRLYKTEIDGMIYFLTGNCHIKWD